MPENHNTALSVPTFSQSGEDRLVLKLFGNRPTGIYVDVGCHHPVRASNTYLLYLKGWRGVAIDADSRMISAFQSERPEDRAVHAGVGRAAASRTYYAFHDRALNTFDSELALNMLASGNYQIVETREIVVRPLAEILAEINMGAFDFLNVDVENLDLEVLQSNDWARWQPEVIAVEDHTLDPEAPASSATFRFLKERGYYLVSKCAYTSIYARTPFVRTL